MPTRRRFVIKWALIALSLGVLGAAALIVTYDQRVFQPRRAQLDTWLERATAEEKVPSAPLSRLIAASVNGHTAVAASREMLVGELSVPQLLRGRVGWRLTAALWTGLVALHLSDSEQIRIIAAKAFLGEGERGFSAAAQSLFHRPLSALSRVQLATLAAMCASPTVNRPGTPALIQARDELLAKTGLM